MENDIASIKNLIIQELANLPKKSNVTAWVSGIINVLDSKTMITSNIDDVSWFHKNGMSHCQSILDFGCGSGYITYIISRYCNKVTAYEYNGEWVGQQYTPSEYFKAFSLVQNIVKTNNQNIDFNFYNKLPLSIDSNSFDGIVMYAVIEHLDKSIESPVLNEINRILKPGGYLFIAKLPRVLSYQEHLARILKIGSHEILYSRKKIINLLHAHGFTIKVIEKTGMFFNHPNKYTNLFFPFLSRIETLINKFFPFLKIFAHDYRIIAVKN